MPGAVHIGFAILLLHALGSQDATCLVDFLIPAEEVYSVLGLNRPIYYMKSGILDKTLIAYSLLLEPHVLVQHFQWRAYVQVNYSIHLIVEEEFRKGSSQPTKPILSIPNEGTVPTFLSSFHMTVACTGTRSSMVTMQVEFYSTKILPLLEVKRKRLCLDEDVGSSSDLTHTLEAHKLSLTQDTLSTGNSSTSSSFLRPVFRSPSGISATTMNQQLTQIISSSTLTNSLKYFIVIGVSSAFIFILFAVIIISLRHLRRSSRTDMATFLTSSIYWNSSKRPCSRTSRKHRVLGGDGHMKDGSSADEQVAMKMGPKSLLNMHFSSDSLRPKQTCPSPQPLTNIDVQLSHVLCDVANNDMNHKECRMSNLSTFMKSTNQVPENEHTSCPTNYKCRSLKQFSPRGISERMLRSYCTATEGRPALHLNRKVNKRSRHRPLQQRDFSSRYPFSRPAQDKLHHSSEMELSKRLVALTAAFITDEEDACDENVQLETNSLMSGYTNCSSQPSHQRGATPILQKRRLTPRDILLELHTPRHKIRLISIIQEGTFGRVWKGILIGNGLKRKEVLIKSLKPQSSAVQVSVCMSDACLLAGLQHHNLQPLLAAYLPSQCCQHEFQELATAESNCYKHRSHFPLTPLSLDSSPGGFSMSAPFKINGDHNLSSSHSNFTNNVNLQKTLLTKVQMQSAAANLRLDEDVPLLIYPFSDQGNLKLFLKKCRAPDDDLVQQNSTLEEEKWALSAHHLIFIGLQIIRGVAFLHERGIIHKDVAARNCFISSHLHCRLSDAALSRDLFPEDYHCLGDNENRPVKWLAIEALVARHFSYASDVWSVGVTLWELITRARQPYEAVDAFEMATYLREGYRLTRPQCCPQKLFDTMSLCWKSNASERPKLSELTKSMKRFHNTLAHFV